MGLTRRDFFKRTGCALSATALLAGIEQFSLIDALAQTPEALSDYKALVCIFMNGGNDGNNTVIPYDGYSAYATVRNASGLAVPQSALLQISPTNLGGVKFGLHPNLSPEVANAGSAQGLLPVWQANKLAVLCNVGTLVQPLTKTQYQTSPSLRPYQLFSHSDQVTQQQTSVSSTPTQTGWGGRISDVLANVNGAAPLPMIISTAGTSLFTAGQLTRPLSVSSTGALNTLFDLSNAPGSTTAEQTSRLAAFNQIRALDNNLALVKATNDSMAQAISTDAAFSQDQTLTTVFPATSLGNQLKQIAKLIKANLTQGSLALKRQIFFCTIGGFDTHTNQTSANPTSPNGAGGQGNLLTQLSQAMKAFYDATVEMEQVQPGLSSQVTTFTLSDFGRTFQPSGSGATAVGSDHGWGSHQFIMGGAVLGGRFYGTYPTLALGGPDDTDSGSNPRGRWIPTTSVDQYAATLARWYGVAAADIPTILPFIGRFATSNLGFLG
jgi:uncharacterized protein (DUF1501 family)